MGKYHVFLGSTFVSFLGALMMMYGLHSSENKLHNPKFAGEFWNGIFVFTVIGIALGLFAVKAYPTFQNKDLEYFEIRMRMLGIALKSWLSLAAVAVMTVLGGQAAGVVSKENGGAWIAFSCFLLAFTMVRSDEAFARRPSLSKAGDAAPSQASSSGRYEL
jgi:hypothetical protein